MDRETRLDQLAADILAGKVIDWPAVESSIDPADSAAVQQLKIVAEIASLHRGLEDAPAATPLVSWGHLQLLERIGSGTFGDVYRAWDTHLDREVALKLLRASPAASSADVSLSDPARVVNEGRLLARVRHPHVITVYGAEPRAGAVGIWMEFIRGRTLHQVVEQQGVLSAREATAIGVDLCGALAAVHAAGLLHRDVSARNVMREDGGRIVLMDFGAGHDDGRAVVSREGRDIAGTPLYMAPELFSGARADQRSDIYAVGALLFHLVTARFPVTGRSLEEVGDAHACGKRTRLRDARPDLPPAFVRTVEKALAPIPAERFQTLGELERVLEDPSAESAIGSPSATWRAGAFLAAALTLGLAIVAAWSLLSSRDETDRGGKASTAALNSAAGLTNRKLTLSGDVWAFSNPSADGRFMAGMVGKTGDVALIDLATNAYRPLGLGRGEYQDGYASLGILSPDGKTVAVEWYHDGKGSLRLIQTDGTGQRDLIPPPAEIRAYEWSRDGSMILAVVQIAPDNNVVCLIAVADAAVRQIRSIGKVLPGMMSLSPDGRYIAYDHPESSGAIDHDIFILDVHTNSLWPFAPSAGEDRAPFWTPDGASLVFLSDRNRSMSLWRAPVSQGRSAGETELIKDNVGRVWLRGFTADSQLHYQLSSGHAEVYIASLDDNPIQPKVISPRMALSNFYPVWSRDGRYVAYTSERDVADGRELWVYDTELQREERITAGSAGIGRPWGWSPDGTQILAGGGERRLVLIDRRTRAIELIADDAVRVSWLTAGLVYQSGRAVTVYDVATRRPFRTFSYDRAKPGAVSVSWDGESVLAMEADGRIILDETATGVRHTWTDPGVTSVGNHHRVPVSNGVAYIAFATSAAGATKTLRFWPRAGPPRELLRGSPTEDFILVGLDVDTRHLLVVRRTVASDPELRDETLWRVPIDGSDPISTGFTMEGLRDISMHPDGRQIAFNAGWKRGEHWVMENLLPR